MYGENAPPSWARLPGARCRAVEHLTKLDGLKEFELFEGLEEGFFQDLAIAAEVLELGADTALYREGEPSGAVYFVGEGRVKLYRTSGGPKARDQILGVVGDGSVLGLGAAIEGRTQGQGATALTDCVLYAVFRDDLRSEEHTSELQSQSNLVCRLLLEKKNNTKTLQQNILQKYF